jgi:D-sedoheptulose 7-phosphate isomerase
MSHARRYLDLAASLAGVVDAEAVERLAGALADVRSGGGRLFVLGVGGSAANASHAVNDFRKLCGIETYAPTDNAAELTARTNDEGWDTTFVEWLRTSRLSDRDAVLVLSVGGGDEENGVSVNLVRAVDEAKRRGAAVLGVVGRNGGHTGRAGDEVVVVPTVDPGLVTPLVESFQTLVLHCLVSHPTLAATTAKWESLAPASGGPHTIRGGVQ